MSRITAKKFKEATGRAPENDDLERCNCKGAGQISHLGCGWCDEHNSPRFDCGCIAKVSTDPFAPQEYEVNVFRIITQSKTMTLKANSPQEAMEQAIENANGAYARYVTVEGSAPFTATILNK